MLRQASPQSWTGEHAVEADRPGQGFRREARRRRGQPGRSRRLDLRPARPQRRRQDHHACACCSGSSSPRRASAACSATTGRSRPRTQVGYLPEERGLYPAMNAREAIAFMGALRGLPLKEAAAAPTNCSSENGLGEWAKKPIRTLSKGMAQTVQLLGTIVHEPRLIVLDEPFSGLDAINQGKLERLIRAARRTARRSSSRPTSSPTPSGCASGSRSSRRARSRSKAASTRRAARLRPIVRLRTRASDGPWRAALPANARATRAANGFSSFPRAGPEPLLKALIDGGAGIETLAIERPGPARRVRRHRRRCRRPGDGRTRSRASEGIAPLRLRDRPPRFHRDGACRAPSSCSCSAPSSRC